MSSTLQHALATALVASFFVLNALQERSYARRGIDARGDLPIPRPLFVFGKAAMVLGWLPIAVQAYVADLRLVEIPPGVAWLAVGIEAVGVAVIALAYLSLGDANQIGLTRAPTRLRTSGLYRLSRNPVYVGFHLLTLSAVLYTMNPFVLALGLASAVVHHRVVLAEEAHLARAFGPTYEAYRRRARRYV